jgi:hypothetical protein
MKHWKKRYLYLPLIVLLFFPNVGYSTNLRAIFDPMLSIARGLFPNMSHVNKFGRNPDIDIATDPEDIWDGGGLWVPPTAARTHDIVSSSANDSGDILSSGTATGGSITTLIDTGATFSSDGVAAGDVVLNDSNVDHSIVVSVDSEIQLTLENTHHLTAFESGDSYRVVNADSTGASIVHLFGLDSGFVEQEEFVVMNGVANVATTRTYWRVWRMHIDGAASRILNNVGTITATAQVDATVTAQISIGNGTTLMAIYTIPAGKTGYMSNFSTTINKGAVGGLANMSLRQTKFAGPDGAGSIVEHYFSLATDGSSNVHRPFRPHKEIKERTDVWIRCESVTANDIDITGAFDIILVDN